MPSEIVIKCSKAIVEKGWNIAFAESASAGRMSAEFSMTEDSGKILRGGIVCYEVFVKEQLLNVPHSFIEKHTPESAEVTQILAQQASKIFNSKITVAITGLTTPGGSETIEKPVGTIFIYIITPDKKTNHQEVFNGSPEEIILQAIDKTAELIIESL
ncbi:CinA family protein [Flavobacterium chungangense]|uniref:Competence/damage-inducible protein A n=1 Tax=Flavobacterium chungangense TaxID=554283 RepID=A0A6V6Z9N2_9FLAO|nr:CinA family protein [Flavobacterium chungangense]CAD0008491.1 competence/damage-inducible protein A [Flavobacterium chungangense]